MRKPNERALNSPLTPDYSSLIKSGAALEMPQLALGEPPWTASKWRLEEVDAVEEYVPTAGTMEKEDNILTYRPTAITLRQRSHRVYWGDVIVAISMRVILPRAVPCRQRSVTHF